MAHVRVCRGRVGNYWLDPEADCLQHPLVPHKSRVADCQKPTPVPRFRLWQRLQPSVWYLVASGVGGGVLDMFDADVLTFWELMMGEP